MADKKFSELTTSAALTNDDIMAVVQMQSGALTSVKATLYAIAVHITKLAQYTSDLQTTDKTVIGAINELKQLISLIPQFSIEVVQALPTEDISDTTIYLVPAEDPETGNYYEEYIHVNDAWELVGTTSVDLSAYYTKLEVDGLLATKANAAEVTAALATKENKSDMPTDVRTIIKDCKTPKSATITNGIAQFECIEENLVKGLKVTMNPIQDLHGYDNPWAGGVGKNKLDPSLVLDQSAWNQFTLTLKPNTQYTASANIPNDGVLLFYFSDTTSYGTSKQVYNGNSITITSNSSGVVYIQQRRTADSASFADYNIMISEGTDTTFAPYENICPISGRTEASVTRTGKNLANIVSTNVVRKNGSFTEIYGENNSVTIPVTTVGSFNIVFSVINILDEMVGKTIYVSGNRSVTGSSTSIDIVKKVGDTYSGKTASYTLTDDDIGSTFCVRCNNGSGQSCTFSNIQFEFSNSATDFEPYQAETHTHQYSETIYGGVDDFVNGECSVNIGMVTLSAFDFSSLSEAPIFRSAYQNVIPDVKPPTNVLIPPNISSEQFTAKGYGPISREDIGKFAISAWSVDRIVFIDNTVSNATEFVQKYGNMKICYELDTPTTISTSAEKITTVAGTNIISGTEPISECQYTELATVDDLRKIIGGAE